MLRIELPESCLAEAAYAAKVLIGDFLGIPHDLQKSDSPRWRVTCPGQAGIISLPDIFLAQAGKSWLEEASLPAGPLPHLASMDVPFGFKSLEATLPILFAGERIPEIVWDRPSADIAFSFDLFGAGFFMLSRYEETLPTLIEGHGRYAAGGSIAAREGFLHRPIVNEYVELLWGAIKALWPFLERRERTFRTHITCDVDHLERSAASRVRTSVRGAASALLRRGRIGDAWGFARNEAEALLLRSTPFRDLRWIMRECERADQRALFYFIVASTNAEYDAKYSISEPHVVDLIREIGRRGHQIGMHNSYGSLGDGAQIRKEVGILAEVAGRADVLPSTIETRAHYLLWDPLRSPRLLDEAGVSYDSSLGYSQVAGFRAGACYEFPMYDLEQRRELGVRQRPLIVMESSIIEPYYMGLGYSAEALEMIEKLKNACRWCDGDFVLLWHNSHLKARADRRMFRKVIR